VAREILNRVQDDEAAVIPDRVQDDEAAVIPALTWNLS
jgi:hypothetical protein